MMITYIVTATLAVVLTSPTTPQNAWQTSYGKALQATKANHSPLLVVLDKPHNENARLAPELLDAGNAAGKQSQLLQPYTLCHVDVTTDYGKKVASAFHVTSFPHVAIIDKSGSTVIFHASGHINASQWEDVLARHRNGERSSAQAVSHVSYKPAGSAIYSDPTIGSSSYCPSCQRRSF